MATKNEIGIKTVLFVRLYPSGPDFVKKNFKSLSLSLLFISQIPPSLKNLNENHLQNQKKKEFEVGTYIRKLIGVSDERWSRGARTIPGFHKRDLSGARKRSGARI